MCPHTATKLAQSAHASSTGAALVKIQGNAIAISPLPIAAIILMLPTCGGVQSGLGTLLVIYVTKFITGGLRVEKEEEVAGLDNAIHGERAFEMD